MEIDECSCVRDFPTKVESLGQLQMDTTHGIWNGKLQTTAVLSVPKDIVQKCSCDVCRDSSSIPMFFQPNPLQVLNQVSIKANETIALQRPKLVCFLFNITQLAQ